jgi:hypothetical protein
LAGGRTETAPEGRAGNPALGHVLGACPKIVMGLTTGYMLLAML